MSSTIQNVIDRAKSFNPLNVKLGNDAVDMCTRVQQHQQRVFTALASLPMALLGSSKFVVQQTLTSSSGASGRTVDLTTVSAPIERILRVSLASSNVDINKVTEFDVTTQLAPRYFIRGTLLNEVGSDWSTVTGTVSINLLYCFGATPIVVTNGTGQNVTVPDEWLDILILPLARYFFNQDPGRDPAEYQWLDSQYAETWNRFLVFATNFPGEYSDLSMFAPPPATYPVGAK